MEDSFIIPDISTMYEYIVQRGLRSPSSNFRSPLKFSSPPHLRVPPLKFLYFVSSPSVCVFFVCMFLKNQLSQSEDEIYCHNSSITLLVSPIRFILLTHYALYNIHKIPSTLSYSFLCNSILGGTTTLCILASW